MNTLAIIFSRYGIEPVVSVTTGPTGKSGQTAWNGIRSPIYCCHSAWVRLRPANWQARACHESGFVSHTVRTLPTEARTCPSAEKSVLMTHFETPVSGSTPICDGVLGLDTSHRMTV